MSRYDKDEIKENLAYHHLMLIVEEIARVARVKLGLNERGMSVQSRRRPFPNSSVVSWDDVPVRADVGELSAGEGEREEKRSGRESDGESCDKKERKIISIPLPLGFKEKMGKALTGEDASSLPLHYFPPNQLDLPSQQRPTKLAVPTRREVDLLSIWQKRGVRRRKPSKASAERERNRWVRRES